ncbi:MAG: aldo/keto reductase [Campylobacteraceae bacterium]|nr:aldo/keto reductase [Campylobacteraceae bacterium]
MEDQKYITSVHGVKIPFLIYGTAWKKNYTAFMVEKAIEEGFLGIDTAAQPKHYNEAQVGVALNNLKEKGFPRESIYLQTKFTPLSGQDPNLIPYDKNLPIEVQIFQSFESSLKNLQTTYVDTLILHSPIEPYPVLLRAWKAMESIQEKKGALQLGLSNCYDLELLKQLCKDVSIKPAVIQNRFYEETNYDKELREWCDKNDIIYQSFWTLTANPHILASDTVESIAKTHSKTPSQILFRYLNQSGVAPLTGTTSKTHMKEDLSILDFELSSTDLEKISDLLN